MKWFFAGFGVATTGCVLGMVWQMWADRQRTLANSNVVRLVR